VHEAQAEPTDLADAEFTKHLMLEATRFKQLNSAPLDFERFKSVA